MNEPAIQEYDGNMMTLLEVVWGEGFMSPGGIAEVDLYLDGIDLRGQMRSDGRVLLHSDGRVLLRIEGRVMLCRSLRGSDGHVVVALPYWHGAMVSVLAHASAPCVL